MATLLFTAIGTVIGGPLGGAIGALVGQQVDSAIFGSPQIKGPRLKELAASTSSYGSTIPRHYGTMRTPGSIIWSTDLVEHKKKSGGGKGKPKVTTYTYSVSFAVALASRPIKRLGRIWADGKLLRGAAGDLKSSGKLRIYTGEYDQKPDPFIAAKEGAGRCPAFRGLAYAMFESLQLADYGNRIPALTFEVIADNGEVSLQTLVEGALENVDAYAALPGIIGFSCEGPLSDTLATLDPVFPMNCDAGGSALIIKRERLQDTPIPVSEASTSRGEGDFGGDEGFSHRRLPASSNPPEVLRYYDIDRDYQPGLQRAPGHPAMGQPGAIELPAALNASNARALISRSAKRTGWAREVLAWRSCEIDPRIAPGTVVTVPGRTGRWRVKEWEWRESGVEFVLDRLPPDDMADSSPADPGRARSAEDEPLAPTTLAAFELPWDGTGNGDTPAIFAAVASSGKAWNGAALFVDQNDGQLQPLGTSGRVSCVMGRSMDILPPRSPMLFDRQSSVIVELLRDDMELEEATIRQLAMGGNRALLGEEIIQFASATPLGDRKWRLEHLLRGRGGTEAAIGTHHADETFALLDGEPVALDPVIVGTVPDALIVAEGQGDETPAISPIALRGITQRPLTPVHPRAMTTASGGLLLRWTRRARGAPVWTDGVDTPLHEQSESYEVTFGEISDPLARWTTTEPQLELASEALANLAATLPGGAFHVRQRGSYAVSEPLFVTRLA